MGHPHDLQCLAITALAALALTGCGPGAATAPAAAPASDAPAPPLALPVPTDRLLAFQIFIGSPSPRIPIGGDAALGAMPSPADLDAAVADIVTRIGTTGGAGHRLAVIFGPLAFDHDDAQVGALIANAFAIARRRHVAVGFHVDDGIYWSRRRDLATAANLESADWQGSVSTGRRLDWGPSPSRAPPQLCINAPPVEAAVRQRGALIGRRIATELARLPAATRGEAFAGVIAGWETQIGRDYASGRPLGYCAAANRGLGPGATADAVDSARVAAVTNFVALWSRSIANGGVPADRIWSHVAHPLPRDGETGHDYLARASFAPAETAFGSGFRPGFSTYPEAGLLQALAGELAGRGNPPWASAEGANVALGGGATGAGGSGMSMETHLAQRFNRGAVLVNIFGWGIGAPDNPFRRAAEAPEAIAAYAKFLAGLPLVEGAVAATTADRLRAKIARIHAEVPDWVRRHNAQARAEPLAKALQRALAGNDLVAAEAAADAMLGMMEGDRSEKANLGTLRH